MQETLNIAFEFRRAFLFPPCPQFGGTASLQYIYPAWTDSQWKSEHTQGFSYLKNWSKSFFFQYRV